MRHPIVAYFAIAKLLVHLAVLSPYGYFRDELYYLACADHLALGYVDHPPLSIALLAAWRAVFGDSVEAIRVVPAFAGAAVVALTGRIARQLGGGSVAVALACAAALFAPGRLGFDHYYSMNALDALLWVLAASLALDATDADSPRPASRRWLMLGLVLGLGLLNKWSVLWLGFGLALGFLATPARAALRSRWPYVAAALALGIAAPHFVWQALHEWPTLEFARNALEHKYVRPSLPAFIKDTILLNNAATLPLWGVGLIAALSDRGGRGSRLLGVVFAVTVVIVAGSRGKPEYLLAAFPLVLAPGAVVWERWIGARRAFAGLAVSVVALACMPLVPFALPVLTAETFIAYQDRIGLRPESSEKKVLGPLPQFYADMHGWPELVAAASTAYATLSEQEKRDAPVWALTGGYGSAAAIDVLGRRAGLPPAISTHNSYWMWGYGDVEQPAAMIVLGDHDRLRELFEDLTLITRVDCGYCMPYEDDKPVYVARGMRRPFADFWPAAKSFQ